MPTNRIQPQSIESEESILAHCLIYDASDVVDSLKPEHFYATSHQIIFEAITKLQNAGDPVELTSVVETLKSDLDRVGGAAYITSLLDCPVPTSVDYYIKTIKSKAMLRTLLSRANNIMQACYTANGNAEQVLDEAQRQIIGIEVGSESNITRVGETLINVLEEAERREFGKLAGLPTGYRRLDYILGGFQRSDSIIVGARPSMGKTSFALCLARNLAAKHIPVGFISLEMSKEQLTQIMVSQQARLNTGKWLTNEFNKSDWERITEIADDIDKAPIYIDDRPGLSHMEVRRTLRKMVKKHHIKAAFIDYMQLMTGDTQDGRTNEVGSISRAIKGMAKELNIPIVSLCQLNRKLEERNNKRPQMSDLRESGEIEQDADVIMFIYRDEVYNPDENNPAAGTAEILVKKHRRGATGTVNMAFLKHLQRFEELQYT